MTIGDLTEIYRVEKKSGTLSAVRPDLYPALAVLLKSQRDEYGHLLSENPDSIMAEGANQRRRKGLQLSKEVVEMRMEKICDMALRGAMGADNPVDMLTKEERGYYSEILKTSREHKGILGRLTNSQKYRTKELVPEPEEPAVKEREVEKVIMEPPAPAAAPAEKLPPIDESLEFDEADAEIPDDELDAMPPDDPMPLRAAAPAVEGGAAPADPDYVFVRVTEDMPTFAGPDRDYTLRKEQIVRMPAMMARAMENRGVAVRVDPSPRDRQGAGVAQPLQAEIGRAHV